MSGGVRKIINYRGRPTEVEVFTPKTPVRRKLAKITETWAKIPHHRGLKLTKKTGDSMLAVLLALEVAVHDAHSNQVEFTNGLLKQYRIPRQAKIRGLRKLANAGVITVEWRGLMAPLVTHHWYTTEGKLKAEQ
jgi:hypothetical protein